MESSSSQRLQNKKRNGRKENNQNNVRNNSRPRHERNMDKNYKGNEENSQSYPVNFNHNQNQNQNQTQQIQNNNMCNLSINPKQTIEEIITQIEPYVLAIRKLRKTSYIVFHNMRGKQISSKTYLEHMTVKWRKIVSQIVLSTHPCAESILDILEEKFKQVCLSDPYILASLVSLDSITRTMQTLALQCCERDGFVSFQEFRDWYLATVNPFIVMGEISDWAVESILRYHLFHLYKIFFDVPVLYVKDPTLIKRWCEALMLESDSVYAIMRVTSLGSFIDFFHQNNFRKHKRNFIKN
jgi:hypothetical protein